VYAIFRQDGDPDNPLARFRVDGAAPYCAAAHEDAGTPVAGSCTATKTRAR
jgi:hypothetical protein